MKYFFFLFLLAILFHLASCCTRAHRPDLHFPQLHVVPAGFTNSEMADKCLYSFDSKTGVLIDSVNFYDYPFSPINLHNPPDQFYVVRVSQRWDTLSHITFNTYTETIRCSKCFPAGNGEAIAIRFKNLRYDLNGMSIQDSEDVIVRK